MLRVHVLNLRFDVLPESLLERDAGDGHLPLVPLGPLLLHDGVGELRHEPVVVCSRDVQRVRLGAVGHHRPRHHLGHVVHEILRQRRVPLRRHRRRSSRSRLLLRHRNRPRRGHPADAHAGGCGHPADAHARGRAGTARAGRCAARRGRVAVAHHPAPAASGFVHAGPLGARSVVPPVALTRDRGERRAGSAHAGVCTRVKPRSAAAAAVRRRAVPRVVTEPAALVALDPLPRPREPRAVPLHVPNLAALVTRGLTARPERRRRSIVPLGAASGTDRPAAGDRPAQKPVAPATGPVRLRRGVLRIRGLGRAAPETRGLGREHDAAPLGAVPVPRADVPGRGRGRGGREGRSARRGDPPRRGGSRGGRAPGGCTGSAKP